jgi:hypothetical protein
MVDPKVIVDSLRFWRVRIRDKLKSVGHRVMPRAGYCFARAVDSIFGREVALISE